MWGGIFMELQNNYIFLPNPYNKKKTTLKENSIRVDVNKSIYSYISLLFPSIKKVDSSNNIFKGKYCSTFELYDHQFSVEFIINKVADYTYLDISVNGIDEDCIIGALEHIHYNFLCQELQQEYIVIISCDAISEYYCNKLYPKLNRLERELRKLLCNIYVMNFGLDYYEATMDTKFVDGIKRSIKTDKDKNTNTNKEVLYLQDFFYSLTYSDIQTILFTPRWSEYDEKLKKDFLLNCKNLSELSDEELRAAFLNHAPKSDWERLFKCKISNPNIQDMIEYIRKQRNKVAHCKLFDKENYIKCNETITALSEEIIAAIKLTEEKDFLEKNNESIRATFSSATQGYQKIIDSLSTAMAPIISFRQEIETLTAPMRKIAEVLQNCYKPIDLTVSMELLAEKLKYLDYDNSNPPDSPAEFVDDDSGLDEQ